MILRHMSLALLALLIGCAGEDSDENRTQLQDDVLNNQLQALEQAESVNQQIQDAAARQRQLIDEQSR